MAEETKCPHCAKPVPPGTPGGLCPECMVKVGIGSEAATSPDGPPPSAPGPPSPEAIARHFPQLELIELLGSGGMGAAHKARQREIDRLVGLKILPSEPAGDPGFAERFTREARALARLSHPNIVGLYDFDLARILGHEPEDFRLTRAREVMGTPRYMAPGQVSA
jgi:eukaryotic-like serine/threonine-protein kinase